MPLYVTEVDVAGLVDMPVAMTVIEDVFAAKSRGEAVNRPRLRVPLVDGNYNVMAASWATHGVVGQKSFTAGPSGVALDVMLYDAAGGGLLAIIEGKRLTQLRTGAVSGIATQRLHAGDGRPVALIGTGVQAKTQLEAVVLATAATKARVFSRSPELRLAFAATMSQRLGLDVTACVSIESCVDDAGVIVTVTNASEPILLGHHLSPGVHVVAAGSNSWLRAELDVSAIERCDRIVVDDLEQAKIECGDLLRAVELGRLSWASVEELGDVVTGRVVGRTSPTEITLFESQGIAIEDVALAERVYRLALERGVGTQVP